MCDNFLIEFHKDEIIEILKHTDKHKCYSININYLELSNFDESLSQRLLTNPENSLKEWQDAVFKVQHNLSHQLSDQFEVKRNVTCRIHTLFSDPNVIETSSFPGNEDADKFIQISGTVIRMAERKLLEFQRQYRCVKCKYPITVEAQYDKGNMIKMPKICSNPEGCTCKSIVPLNEGQLNSYDCRDYQEIKLQEDLSKVNDKKGPNTLTVTLENDLVNLCKPGENVIITGIVKRRWSEFEKGVKIIIDIVLRANHIRICNQEIIVSEESKNTFKQFWTEHQNDELIGRNIILKSIAPELYGLHLVKLGIAIVLAGGCYYDENECSAITGVNIRSDSHLLLVGDPGTGKSQMLKFASKILPRSVLTTGVGSTSSGLTVAAIMDGGEWQLEAGALVMSDGGICCIDEFNTMKEHDRTSIHEAMEQQTISVAKAGLVCKLKTRCSILAACNPKGNIDITQPLCMNVAMSSPLLSRFDLLFLLRDVVNDEQDRKLAEYQLQINQEINENDEIWDLNKLKEYYVLIRQFKPKLSKAAETILSTYYQLQRKFSDRNMSRTTVRLLESLVRLSQGHAKLLFHSEVHVIDAIFAIILIDTSLDYNSSILHLKIDNNSFIDSPNALYMNLLDNILKKLNLEDIYYEEFGRSIFSQPNTTQQASQIISSQNSTMNRNLETTNHHYSTIENIFEQNQNSMFSNAIESISVIRPSPNQINESIIVNEKANRSLDSGYESKIGDSKAENNVSPFRMNENELNTTISNQYDFSLKKSSRKNVLNHWIDENNSTNEKTENVQSCNAFRVNSNKENNRNISSPKDTILSERQQLSQKYQNMTGLDDLLSDTDGDDPFNNIIHGKFISRSKQNSSTPNYFKGTDKTEMNSNTNQQKKRSSNFPTEKNEKKMKQLNNSKPFQDFASINDDFLNFNIDFDFQYISQSSTSSQKPIAADNNRNVNDNLPAKQATKIGAMLAKYEFVPHEEHKNNENRDESIKKTESTLIDKSPTRSKADEPIIENEIHQPNKTPIKEIEQNQPTKAESSTKKPYKFKRLESVLNMAELDQDIENFEISADWLKFSRKQNQSVSADKITSGQTEKNSSMEDQTIFDMSQNSTRKYIKDKFNFKRV